MPEPRTSKRKRLRSLELAWLAGFIDGEGSIFLTVEYRRVIKPNLNMDNTNRANIRQARRYVQRLTTHDIRPRIGNANRGYRPCYSLRVHRANEIRVVLNAVMPWLVGRRRQAELMLEYLAIAPRKQLDGRPPVMLRFPDGRLRTAYQPRHFKYVERMRALNRRYPKGEWARRGVLPLRTRDASATLDSSRLKRRRPPARALRATGHESPRQERRRRPP